MQIKPQDLQSYEAYKKAMLVAARAIGKNTPFCIYTDVLLPDATKKMRLVKPFLVVGTPPNVIAAWVKPLQGTKKFVTSGICSLQNGKISLVPSQGKPKVNYGLIKMQAAILKDLFGKPILIPIAKPGAPGADDGDAAEEPVTATPVAEAIPHAPAATVAAAAAKATVPPPAAKPGAEPHHVRLSKASMSWHGTRGIVDGKCKDLKAAIRDHYGNHHPDVLKEIEKNMHKIDSVVDKLDHRLTVSLQKASAAHTDAARAAELNVARGILNEYIRYVKAEPLITHIDENPFGVQCNLRQVLATSLREMSQSLIA